SCRRSFSCNVTQHKRECPIRLREVVEEVAANRAAGHRCSRNFEVSPSVARLRKQGALNVGRDLQLVLPLCLFQQFTIESRPFGWRLGLASEMQQKPAEVVHSPLLHNLATVPKGKQENERSTERLPRRRQSHQPARVSPCGRDRPHGSIPKHQELVSVVAQIRKSRKEGSKCALNGHAADVTSAD